MHNLHGSILKKYSSTYAKIRAAALDSKKIVELLFISDIINELPQQPKKSTFV